MSAFEALLQVQESDTTADQLRHRWATLPERSELAALEQRLIETDARLSEVRARREDVTHRQARLEDAVRSFDARVGQIEQRLYSGTVTASRDLQAMSEEVTSIKRRRSSVEDDVLAAMEEGEPLSTEVEALEAERSELEAKVARVRALLAEAEAGIDDEIASEKAARASAAENVPGDLMRTYEGLRSKLRGVGAARLVGASCSGCHLVLPAAEVARVKREPPDALVFCDQCGRILVR